MFIFKKVLKACSKMITLHYYDIVKYKYAVEEEEGWDNVVILHGLPNKWEHKDCRKKWFAIFSLATDLPRIYLPLGSVFEMHGLWCECGLCQFWDVRLGTKHRDSWIGIIEDILYSWTKIKGLIENTTLGVLKNLLT